MNMDLKVYLKKWLPFEISACPRFIQERLGEFAINEIASKNIHASYSYCNDEKFFEPAFIYCKIKGSTVHDFKYRMLSTPFGEIVTSIRFIGGDLNKPAVFIMRQDFEIKYAEQIKKIGALLKKEYALFKPKRFRWYSTKIENDLIKKHNFVAGDLIRITGFINELKKQSPPKNYDSVRLEKAQNLDWYDSFFEAYKKIHQQNPRLIEISQALEKDVAQQLMNKEQLFKIIIKNQFAGIIAANDEDNRFSKGFVVYEELLFEAFRKKHFAAAAQFHLIEQLKAQPNDMLFGTIHSDNPASLKTALRCGRQVIGQFIFADI